MMNILNAGEKHVACVLLVDVSGSMNCGKAANSYDAEYTRIDELNAGLKAFGEALKKDSLASGCADICIISFSNTVDTVMDWTPAAEYQAPVLTASGKTALNEAVITGLDLIEERKQLYKRVGVDYWRPWMFLITDGSATDVDLDADAHQRIQEALDGRKLNFFPLGIGEVSMTKLKSYTKPGSPVLQADQVNFKDAFVWLSNSIVQVSHSNPMEHTESLNVQAPPSTITISL